MSSKRRPIKAGAILLVVTVVATSLLLAHRTLSKLDQSGHQGGSRNKISSPLLLEDQQQKYFNVSTYLEDVVPAPIHQQNADSTNRTIRSNDQAEFIRRRFAAHFTFDHQHPCASRKIAPDLLQILLLADIRPHATACRHDLPVLWDTVTAQFGPALHVIGLDTCATLRATAQRHNGTIKLGIGGLYNSGTNVLRLTLLQNLQFRAHHDIVAHNEVGEPLPITQLHSNRIFNLGFHKHRIPHEMSAQHLRGINKHAILPVIVTRDPLHWMLAMCKAPYTVNNTNEYGPCPRVWQRHDHNNGTTSHATMPATVREYSIVNPNYGSSYDSLAHYWAQYHQEYLNVTFPRLLVRYEDLLFHGQAVLDSIASCLNGPPSNHAAAIVRVRQPYAPYKDKAKIHGRAVGLLDAMIRYNDVVLHNLTPAELQHVATHVWTPPLLQALGMPRLPLGGGGAP